MITKETEEFKNTRKEIENKHTPKRYDNAWVHVAVSILATLS